MSKEPRGCKKLGTVDGEGGGAEHARKDARDRALERGATHMILESPELDIDDQLTTVVTATIFECPADWSPPPPTGYP